MKPVNVIYICGPMTGYHHWNFPAFDAAEKMLKKKGYEVISPAAEERKLGFNEKVETECRPAEEYITEDVQHVLNSDALYILNGWAGSKGARAKQKDAQESRRFPSRIR